MPARVNATELIVSATELRACVNATELMFATELRAKVNAT